MTFLNSWKVQRPRLWGNQAERLQLLWNKGWKLAGGNANVTSFIDSVVVLLRVRNKPHMNSFQEKGTYFFSLIVVKILVNDKAPICFVMAPGFHTGAMHKSGYDLIWCTIRIINYILSLVENLSTYCKWALHVTLANYPQVIGCLYWSVDLNWTDCCKMFRLN